MYPQHGHAAGRDVFVELIPLDYSGAVPAPLPACTDPTPDEQRRHAAAEKKAALKQKEARQKAQYDLNEGQTHSHHTTAGQGSASITDQLTTGANEMFSSIKSVFSKAVLTLEKGATDVSTRTEAQVHQLEHQHDCDRFRTHFRELAEQGEVLLADYVCKAMHGGHQVKGHLQITRNYMCFFAETSSAIAKTTDAIMDAFAAARQAASANASAQQEQQQRLVGIKQVVPLSCIASIQPSVVLETVAGQAPFFMLSPAPTVSPTALQVYTTDKKIYQFLKFDSLMSRATGALSDVKGTALDGAYCYLDRAWRDAVTVPLSNVEYA
ncbi:hypothetical protein JKF63_07218 [Porcisia hertigi]|uniref:GRAM domain-containing protein n=1 Tax=Porcisia hertigi TaxID=2761500 RepID=A0A836YJN8_9TRYP|nr:hypothetical protein JKF63_07218 [Porcisia hertigi]